MKEKDEFIRQFREIQPKFSRFYARLLTEASVSLPQFALLSQLAVEGPLSMTGVGRKLHVTKPAVTHLVDRLEKNGFLRRQAHPKDRRIFLLEIHPKGEKLVRKVQSEALRLVLETLKEFTAKEKETLVRFYTLLSQMLDGVLAKR